jgi:hypothetical protein
MKQAKSILFNTLTLVYSPPLDEVTHMGVKTHPNQSGAPAERLPLVNESQKAAVLQALEDIQNSKAFRTSPRCKQFLSYIVERALEGQVDLLKERTLGVELFQRLPTYATGEDAVVRVEAGEVRKRLKQYYAAEAQSPEVRIEIPLGSYIPEFHWNQVEAPAPITKKARFPATIASHLLTISLTALVMMGGFALLPSRMLVHPASAVEAFWAPLLASPQPVLICVPSPVIYLPSEDLYRKYAKTHPGADQTPMATWGTPLNLDPNERVPWKDMVPYRNKFMVQEDSYAAANLLMVFDRIGKPSQLRSLAGLSSRDLRNFPAVLVGAFDNPWTLELTTDLPFTFDDEGEIQTIRERAAPGIVWSSHLIGTSKLKLDYATASRLTRSSTGQVLIIVAGIGAAGTEAAGEFLSHPDYLSNALRSAPPGWQKMNFQAVLQTEVSDGVAGPPQVVATRFW